MDKILTGHELPSFADTYSRVNRIVRGQSDSPSGSDNITFVSQNSNGTSVTQRQRAVWKRDETRSIISMLIKSGHTIDLAGK